MIRTRLVSSAVLALLMTGAVPARACLPTHAYIDCSATSDGKGTEASPYNSLSDVNRLALMAGDSIDFKRGATCQGTLSPSGSGDPSQPVQIGAYGPGTALPAVAASGPTPSVKLANQQNLTISDLALSGGQAGVTATASDYGAMRGITLRGLDIHDVTDGIVLQAAAGAAPSALDDVRVLANRIHGISGSAVTLSSDWCRRPDVAPDWRPSCTGAWSPARDLQISDNLLYGIGGDGIEVATTQGASVTHNWLEGFGGTGLAVSDSTGATVAANQVSGGRPVPFGVGYQIGAATDHTTLQGNLSHDNGGGFLMFDSEPQAPIGPVSVLGNISIDDHGNGLQFSGGPVSSTKVAGNTVYIGSGVAQEVASSTTGSPLDVQFAGNIVTAAPDAGIVGWNLANPGWVVRDDLLHGVPAPTGAAGTSSGSPGFAAAGGADPFGYRLLAGSPALGSGVPLPASAAFPLSLAPVPSAAPNIGAVQAAAGPAVVLSDTFDGDRAGAAPAGWTVTGPAVVTADPASFAGRSLSLTGPTSAGRSFGATGGDVRIDLRIYAGQATKPVSVQVLDTRGRPVLNIGLGDKGQLTYSSGSSGSSGGGTRDTSFVYPVSAWTDLSMLLYPARDRYTLSADGQQVANGKLTPGSGIPGRIAVAAPAGGTSVAVDDVMVSPACCPC